MGCVSSTLLMNQDKEFPKLGGSAAFSQHIVSLTSTTYGLLTTLDNPPPPPPPLETINSWDLMSGLDPDDHVPSFRYLSTPNNPPSLNSFVEKFEKICPPKGEKRVVLYSTSLRGVRKTFEDCEAVRSAIRGVGIPVVERDISMDRGFRDELRELMKGKGSDHFIPPRLFVDGRYVGGVEEVIKIVDQVQGSASLQGLPLPPPPPLSVCEGCGGVGFLPCFTCHGSCKQVKGGGGGGGFQKRRIVFVVLKCSHCNENGLVLCPICSSN